MNDEIKSKDKNRSRIPHYAEIKVDNYSIFELTEKFKEEGIGEIPLYIDLSILSDEQTLEAIQNISQSLILLNLHPYFPYPLYVITDKVNDHEIIPIIASPAELPSHFDNKIKRLKQKEQLLLNKVKLKSNRLANIALYDKVAEIKNNLKIKEIFLQLAKKPNSISIS